MLAIQKASFQVNMFNSFATVAFSKETFHFRTPCTSELFCTTPYLIKKYLSFLCNLIYLLKKVFNKFQAHELPPYISSLKLERAAVGSSKSTKSLKSHALGA